MLRAKDAAARERIALAMERACANNNIGYSQPTRNTLYSDVKPYGFDPAKTTKKVNTDCSALVRVCVNFAGIAAGDFMLSGITAFRFRHFRRTHSREYGGDHNTSGHSDNHSVRDSWSSHPYSVPGGCVWSLHPMRGQAKRRKIPVAFLPAVQWRSPVQMAGHRSHGGYRPP